MSETEANIHILHIIDKSGSAVFPKWTDFIHRVAQRFRA